jgi:hypothetical protein
LGTANGLRVLQESAVRCEISLTNKLGEQDSENLDPKEIALRIYLDFPEVFNVASDILSYTNLSSYSEFAGSEEGIEPQLTNETSGAFQRAAEQLLQSDLRGRYCRIGSYEDGDEINIVITHGAAMRTTEVIDRGADRVISFRETEHAILSYSPLSGRLKIGGLAKARRSELAEIFAATMLQRPGFLSGEDSQNLYSLRPVERSGFAFMFNHAFDPGIRSVQITEVQVDRIVAGPLDARRTKPLWSVVARDGRDNALRRLSEIAPAVEFASDRWRLNHLSIRVIIQDEDGKLVRVPVKLKPPGTAMFKRYRFEHRIMTLLRRNGLSHDRATGAVSVAAE